VVAGGGGEISNKRVARHYRVVSKDEHSAISYGYPGPSAEEYCPRSGGCW
jgi:hypothetical protein